MKSGAIGLFIGLALLVVGGWVGHRLYTIWVTWPSLDAVVASGSVEEFTEYPTARGSTVIRRFRPRIEFRYSLNGKDYMTQVSSDFSSENYEKVRKGLVTTYAVGTHHAIRYNPQDPGELRFGSVDPGTLALSLFLVLLGLVFCVDSVNAMAIMTAESGAAHEPGLWQRAKASGLVLRFRTPPSEGPAAAATLRCPSCGESVQAKQDICPRCSKSLRAA